VAHDPAPPHRHRPVRRVRRRGHARSPDPELGGRDRRHRRAHRGARARGHPAARAAAAQ
jgi:hypothetical protein